jgi:hypothetical protein
VAYKHFAHISKEQLACRQCGRSIVPGTPVWWLRETSMGIPIGIGPVEHPECHDRCALQPAVRAGIGPDGWDL